MTIYQQELKGLRQEIDAVDAALVQLVQKRFAIVDRVVVVKKHNRIPAMLPDRIEEVVKNVVALAKPSTVPPQTIENLWRLLIAETIAYEEKALLVK